MSSLIQAGIMGTLVGSTLGAPHKGRSSFVRMNFYDPIPIRMSPSEGLDAWWVWLTHMRGKRGKGALGASLYAQWTSTQGETAFGLSNMSYGFSSTLSGRLRNPLREGSTGFTRAIFWGLAFHGSPDEAAQWAYYDAGLDHAEDGLTLAACLAWMVASAKPGATPQALCTIFTRALPVSSLFLKALPKVLDCAGQPEKVRELRQTLPGHLGLVDEEHAALSMSWVVASLLASPVGFGTSLLLAAGCGGSSDQTGAAVGAISALLTGEVGKDWTQPIGRSYISSHALRGVEAPAEIETFIKWIEELHSTLAPAPVAVAPAPVVEAAPCPDELAEDAMSTESPAVDPDDSEPVPEAPVVEPVAVVEPLVKEPAQATIGLIRGEATFTSSEQNGVEVSWTYLDEPVSRPQQSIRLNVVFRNETDEEKEIYPELIAPENWKAATRMTAFRLAPRGFQAFPLVLQSPQTPIFERVFVKLRVGTGEYRSPILPAQNWHLVGPFVNHEGTGFEKSYPAESIVKRGQVFNGRSDLPVKWEQKWFSGSVFDLEPEFRSGPGVVLLWAKVNMPAPGRYKIMVSSSVGVIVSVDGQKVLAYHDEHQPNPRNREKYSGSFASVGESTIMVKVLRNKKPLQPLVISFFTEDGQVVQPLAFHPME